MTWKKTSGVKLERVVWGQIVKGRKCHNSWSLDFVPQATGSPQRLQEIRDVIIFILLVSDFGSSVEDGVRRSPGYQLRDR